MLVEGLEFLAFKFRVVHLTQDVNHILEVVAALFEIVEGESAVADVQHELEHIFLPGEGTALFDGLRFSIEGQDSEAQEYVYRSREAL